MGNSIEILKGFKTAESRWARFGPYYAMFPLDFAFEVIEKYSSRNEYIIDPFAGRGSSLYAGAVLGRTSLGIEINPVGWLYGSTKLKPAGRDEVIDRLLDICAKKKSYASYIKKLSPFFRMCYCDDVLEFLLTVRDNLDWKNDTIDATLMSIILIYLHGKLGEGLSNQMRMTKAMGVNYSINWWNKNGFKKPPVLNPRDFIFSKILWRYGKGVPHIKNSLGVINGDSSIELNKIIKKAKEYNIRFSLLFTSPPYNSITDYHADQWLRLWLLGGPENPQSIKEKHKGRFVSKIDYENLLDVVFKKCSSIMAQKSTIYVRTDAREYTYEITLEILKKYFPDYSCQIIDRPVKGKTQTQLFGDKSKKPGEVDLIFKRT